MLCPFPAISDSGVGTAYRIIQNLTRCRSALDKVSKMANIIHLSTLFRSSFEATFGAGRTIPQTNLVLESLVFLNVC